MDGNDEGHGSQGISLPESRDQQGPSPWYSLHSVPMLETFASWPAVWQALAAASFTWGLTAIGAGVVFFFRDVSRKTLDAALGFTAGVMIAASFWSLLNPAIALSGTAAEVPGRPSMHR